MIWYILGAISIVLLLIYWNNRGAVWGGFTIGIIIGFVVAIIFAFKGNGVGWHIIGKGAMIGTIVGFITELLGIVSNKLRKK